jgi:hypothetical protein
MTGFAASFGSRLRKEAPSGGVARFSFLVWACFGVADQAVAVPRSGRGVTDAMGHERRSHRACREAEVDFQEDTPLHGMF